MMSSMAARKRKTYDSNTLATMRDFQEFDSDDNVTGNCGEETVEQIAKRLSLRYKMPTTEPPTYLKEVKVISCIDGNDVLLFTGGNKQRVEKKGLYRAIVGKNDENTHSLAHCVEKLIVQEKALDGYDNRSKFLQFEKMKFATKPHAYFRSTFSMFGAMLFVANMNFDYADFRVRLNLCDQLLENFIGTSEDKNILKKIWHDFALAPSSYNIIGEPGIGAAAGWPPLSPLSSDDDNGEPPSVGTAGAMPSATPSSSNHNKYSEPAGGSGGNLSFFLH